MQKIFLVTGSAGKLAEWKRLLPNDLDIESIDVDLTEIQSIDPEEIVADKARRAYEIVGKPVVVEDVSVGLANLNGMPGPFVKFFVKSMGENALFTLAQKEGVKAVVSCVVAYYDGNELLTVRGDVHGTVVSARGENGFGFDKTFIPNGAGKTYGEMSSEEKDQMSHRSKAINLLARALTSKHNLAL